MRPLDGLSPCDPSLTVAEAHRSKGRRPRNFVWGHIGRGHIEMTSCFCSIPKTNFVARDLLKYPKVNQKSGPYAKENFPAEYFLEQCELY